MESDITVPDNGTSVESELFDDVDIIVNEPDEEDMIVVDSYVIYFYSNVTSSSRRSVLITI